MDIHLELMTENNLKDIFEFECRNKVFFETILPPRNKGYYDWESFQGISSSLIDEQNNNEIRMFVIYNGLKMIGRINLSSIAKDLSSCELGYRVDQDARGAGVATQAVKLIIDEAIALGLECIHAGTATTNIGSQKVLIKNGFEEVSREKNVMKVNNISLDGILYQKRLK